MRAQIPTAMIFLAGSVCLIFNTNGVSNQSTFRKLIKTTAVEADATEHTNVDHRLRVVTFNAKFLPYMPSNRTRAHVLAQRLTTGDYDIIALNEVFSESVRTLLSKKLAPIYPYAVTYMGSRRFREDSGLMLFSRFPFVKTQYTTDDHTADAGVDQEIRPVLTRFQEFNACMGTDCFAGKGVGHALLDVRGHRVHVFFAHLQATYQRYDTKQHEEVIAIRRTQIQTMSRFITQVLDQTKQPNDLSLILGDLNVDGGANATETPDGWIEMMTVLNQAFDTGLIDVWERYASPASQGLTYPTLNPQARYDYILLHQAKQARETCIRGVHLVPELAAAYTTSGRKRMLSDHVGLSMELGIGEAYCPLEHRATTDQMLRPPGRTSRSGWPWIMQ